MQIVLVTVHKSYPVEWMEIYVENPEKYVKLISDLEQVAQVPI